MSYKQVFERALTANDHVDACGIGKTRTDWDGNMYRWVQNKDTDTDFALGDVVYHDLDDAANLFKYIGQCATADLSVLAGVVVSTDGIKSSTGTNPKKYGWIQCYGYNASISCTNTTNVTVALGDYLKGVNGASYMTRDTTTTPVYQRHIQALEAYATHTTPSAALKKGFIHAI